MTPKKRRAPPAVSPPAEDAPGEPSDSSAPEPDTRTSPPAAADPRTDPATIETREENQRLLAQGEEDEEDEEDRDITPGYQVDGDADEFRNVWG